MKHSKLATCALLPLASVALTGPALAYDPIVEENAWPRLDYAADGECEGEIRGNGKIFLINAVGLGSEQPGRYYLTNQDMVPIDWEIVTGPNGEWMRYYIPFLPGGDHEAGTVNVSISTRYCSLNLTFDWDTYIPENDWSSKRALDEALRREGKR
ncbi:MAG TPA: hypothetical protein VLA37_12035 [Sphingomonadaceae bacterium]|nr:hypothetical protein [Sphingomonadaceae bacterium]